MSEPPALPGLIAAAADMRCGICGGSGLVCEDHPSRTWESGEATDCTCMAPGMPCACTGLP